MIKHSRKRQKLDDRQPLGSSNRTAAASEKDDEERRLEELIFGVPFVPSAVNAAKSRTELVDDDDEGEGIHSTGKEMDGLLDSDIFFVDDGGPPPPPSASQSTRDEDDTNNLERGSDDNGSDDEPPSHPPPLDQSTSRKAAWSDPADAPLAISVAPSDPSTSKRALKLRDSQNETVLSGREYERRLRRQFTKINPEPIWALKARDKIHGQVKRRRSSQSGSEVEQDDSEENEDSNIDHLLTSTSGVLRKGRSSKFLLPPTTLNINRLRDANQSVQSNACGDIKSLAFHPNPHVPLLCVASKDNRYRLFQVDGHTSPLLQTLLIPSLPPTSTSTTFHPSGGHLLLTGARPYYFTYDLQAQRMTQSARGLWGTTFSGANDSSIRADRGKRGRGKDGGEPIQHHAFHPSDGSLLAVAGRGGYVHLVDWGSGSGQVIDSLKMSSAVKGLWWGSLPMGFSDDDGQSVGGGDYLVSLSNDSEVYIWDVGSRRCVRRWRDEGGFRGAGLMLAGSAHGGQASLAIGSNTGLVNVYGSDALAPSPNRAATSSNPKPHKTLGQLVTSVTSLRFNRDGQILAMASREKKDALRLVHAHSLTAFANWPTASTPLGHVTSIDFSAGNDHMAVGNSRGKVLLYQLRDYGV
ncbi:U3 snoRNP protein [Pleurotus ostreatus]|nr:U3 snoRNP protein [Pleurotus ostreatus]